MKPSLLREFVRRSPDDPAPPGIAGDWYSVENESGARRRHDQGAGGRRPHGLISAAFIESLQTPHGFPPASIRGRDKTPSAGFEDERGSHA
jgi:hypothetical protein